MQYSPSCATRRSATGNRLTGGRCKNGRQVSAKWFIRFSIILGVFFISTVIFAVNGKAAFTDTENDLQGASKYSSGRNLLSAGRGPNETRTVPVYERCDFEEAHLPYAWLVLYAICVLIFFIALAIICDDFFVPSLEVISEELQLSEDVAGATFMAAGSSAPELFTSIAGVAFDSDVGVGTIVGSAVFNINIIIALTAALAGQVLVLDPRPLIRDSFFYALSIVAFIAFAWDGKFELYEAIIMLLLYFVYIIMMKFNTQIMNMACCRPATVNPVPLDEEGSLEGSAPEDKKMKESSSTLGSFSNVGPPQANKLPPIPSGAELQRKESLGVPSGPSDTNSKHVFHHDKKGELSHHFTPSHHHHTPSHHHHTNEHGVWYLFVVKGHPTQTHSSIDLRKDLDCDSETGRSRPASGRRSRASRPPSANSMRSKTSNINNNLANGHTNVSIVTNGNVPNGNHSSSKGDVQSRTGLLHQSSSIQTTKDLELGEIESLGDDSNYGSQTRLQPPNSNSDFDSGIHSALGPTPVQSFNPSSTDPSNSSNSKKHGDGEHDEGKPGEDRKEGGEEEEPTLRPIPCLPAINMYYPEKDVLQDRCGCLKYILKWIFFFISFPFVCAFTWTIPNCGEPSKRKYYVASFCLSVLWIAAISFAMVTLVIRAGCILNVNHYTMGLVIVAVGTSVPDALSSILVARDGFGDMAVSNALGSNVFDIDLGLGLPFVISIAIKGGAPMMLLKENEMQMWENGEMLMTPHAKFGFILLAILIFTLVVFCAVRFRLTKTVSFCFVGCYVLFLIYAFVQEFACKYSC